MPRSYLDEPPSAERIRELHDFIQADKGWQAQRDLDQKFLPLYYDLHGIAVPNTAAKERRWRIEPERFSTGEPPRIIDLIGSFYVQWPKLGVQYVGSESQSETRAETAARGLNECFDQLNPPTGDSPWIDGGQEQDLLGRCVDLILPTKHHYADYPFKKPGQSEQESAEERRKWRAKAPLPIVWFTLPAASTFPASLSTADDEVLSTLGTTWLALLDQFSEKELAGVLPDEKKDWTKAVTLGIYSNRQHLAYCVLGEKPEGGYGVGSHRFGGAYRDKILRPVEHKLGRCAIRIHPGLTTARKEPGFYWRSVLYPVLGLLEAADKLATAARTGAKFDVSPLMQEWRHQTVTEETEGAKGQVEEFFDVITYDPGDAREGRGREGMEPIFVPQNNQQTRELLVWTLERIQRMTGAIELLEGQGPNETAWGMNFKGEMAKGKLRPITSRRVRRGIGIAESIAAAVVALDEPIPLARFDADGKKTGGLELTPKDMEQFRPVLSGTYEAQLPQNWRADADIGAKLMALALKGDIIHSPQKIARDFWGIENFWTELWRDRQEVKYMLSEPVQRLQEQDIADRFEAALDEEDQMTLEQFEREAQGLPPETANILRSFVGKQRARPGPAVSPETAGALNAAEPFNRPAGGPQPVEQMAPLQ